MATILVVDDEPVVMQVVCATLSRDRHTVLEAVSVTSGCALGDGHNGVIDLLIIDYRLWDGLGWQVAEHLLKTRPALKVMHISGHPLEIIVADDNLTPSAAFLAKPFLPKTLSATVTAMLGGPLQESTCAGT